MSERRVKTLRVRWHKFLRHIVETSVYDVKGVGVFRFYRCSCGARWGRGLPKP